MFARLPILIIPKLNSPDSPRVQEVIARLKETAFSRVEFFVYPEEIDCVPMAVIAVGGDGTMVFAAKYATEKWGKVPVIGINVGKRGFLTDFAPDAIDFMQMFDQIQFTSRMMLKLELPEFPEYPDVPALNEIVISNLYSDRVIRYDFSVNGIEAKNHISNSLILATPTGSTAYALNVGGAIIDPDLHAIEIIPVAAQSFTASMRPLIMAGSSEICVKVSVDPDDTISVKVDGQEFAIVHNDAPVPTTVELNVSRHDRKPVFTNPRGWNFFEVLTDKLHWNR